VTFNDQDYTNDGVKYGFMDPYILGVSPRLVSTKGTTVLSMTGYGLVQMEDSKSVIAFKAGDESLTCKNGALCTKVYKVVNEHAATVETIDQAQVMKKSGLIGYEPWNVYIMNPDGDFTPNTIKMWYYMDLVFSNVSTQFAYANEEKPLIIKTEFNWGKGNDYQRFIEHATLTCRFTSSNSDAPAQVTVPAYMEQSPIGSYKKNQLPDQIRCRTPKWNTTETITLEVSVNGQDYMGGYQIQIVEPLTIKKISPLAGPIGGATKVKLFGTGF
jgi:hypothetical protein